MICNFRGRFSKLPKDRQLGCCRLKANIYLPIKIKSVQCILLTPQSFHLTQLLLFIYKGEMGFDKIVLISLNRKMICFSCYSQCRNQAYFKKWAAATVLVNNTLSRMYFERRLFGKQSWSFLTWCKHVTTLNLCAWFQFLRAFHSFFKKNWLHKTTLIYAWFNERENEKGRLTRKESCWNSWTRRGRCNICLRPLGRLNPQLRSKQYFFHL